ncbi:MAG: ABC transporter ATP-binding protein [Anaerolineae bacterium]
MITVRGLTKYYGSLPAIRDVSFEVAAGEVLGFLGPNAAGKTTTMRILAGYMPPTAGQALVAGYDVVEQSLEARRHIGYLPESVALYPEMSVRSYLEFMAVLRGVRPARRRKQRVDAVMAQCQITHMADRPVGKLSRGYRQRVGLAQALVHDPEVLILDEPTVGLDPAQIIEVRDLIRELGRDHTIILSTHILSEVEHVCQRVMIIHRGRLVAEDTRDRLRARLKGGELLYLEIAGAPPEEITAGLSHLPHVQDVRALGDTAYQVTCPLGSDIRAGLAQFVVQQGWQLLELRRERVSLEEIFLQLTSDEPRPDYSPAGR